MFRKAGLQRQLLLVPPPDKDGACLTSFLVLTPSQMNPPLEQPVPTSDIWAEWLLRKRHGGNLQLEGIVRDRLEQIRNRLLDGARLAAGMTLVDVGSGDGLVAFGAIDRIGPSLQVIMTDISLPLLAAVETRAAERGVRASCRFLHGSAEKLAGLADESADVVTARAVLTYVADKAAALRECCRVLKPGGRLSIAEPIFRDRALELVAMNQAVAAQGGGIQRLLVRYFSAQFPATAEAIDRNPITNFSERLLISLCQLAGFGEIHVELHIDVHRKTPVPWDAFLDCSPHPLAPTLREVGQADFSDDERRQIETFLRPIIESGSGFDRDTIAYLTALKPERLSIDPDGVKNGNH
jgi:ubiquinone/menaquinone biosynthesis C-methylase UbiE